MILAKIPVVILTNSYLQNNRQDPMESYKILQEFYGVLISSGKDPTVVWTRSYEILQDPTVS